jgi:hypothetical protein
VCYCSSPVFLLKHTCHAFSPRECPLFKSPNCYWLAGAVVTPFDPHSILHTAARLLVYSNFRQQSVRTSLTVRTSVQLTALSRAAALRNYVKPTLFPSECQKSDSFLAICTDGCVVGTNFFLYDAESESVCTIFINPAKRSDIP